MKRFILAAFAASMLATTGAYADTARPQIHYDQKHKAGRHIVNKKVVIHKKVVNKRVVKHRWGKGKRVPDWQRRQTVRDYGRHGLRKPGRDQRWIKVDNDYLLIGITSGIVASILAGQ